MLEYLVLPVFFGALRRSVFGDHMLSTTTKCMVYQAVVLGVLLYAVETWPVKQREVRILETFHHRCLRTLLGISRALQIFQHISNEEVRSRAGLTCTFGRYDFLQKVALVGPRC